MDSCTDTLIMSFNHKRTAGGAMNGFPLAQASNGETVEILKVEGGAGAHRKLTDLGLAPGQRVEIITRQPGGPVLLAVGDARVAVGFGLACKLRVRPALNGGCAR